MRETEAVVVPDWHTCGCQRAQEVVSQSDVVVWLRIADLDFCTVVCEVMIGMEEERCFDWGLEAISEKCFGGANIECVLDDGLTMDKMLGMGWHRKYIPEVHRVLRIETVAQPVLSSPTACLRILTMITSRGEPSFLSGAMQSRDDK